VALEMMWIYIYYNAKFLGVEVFFSSVDLKHLVFQEGKWT